MTGKTAAAQAAGISRRMTFKERALSEQFAFALGLAKAEAADRMEAEAYRRAVEGVARQRKIGDQRRSLTADAFPSCTCER